MRVSTIIIVLGILTPTALMAAGTSDDSAAVADVLDELHSAAASADGDRYFSLFADNAIFIGTDAGERWSMQAFRAYAMPYFREGQGWSYEPTERHVTLGADGRTAWFDELLENEKYGVARSSGVLVKSGDAWQIAQYRLGFPIPNELAPEITRRIRQWRASSSPGS